MSAILQLSHDDQHEYRWETIDSILLHLYIHLYMHNSIETYRKSKEKNYLASIAA